MRKLTPAIGNRYPTRRAFRMPLQQRCLISVAMLFGMVLALDAAPQAMTALSAIVGDKLFRFGAYASLSTLIYAGLNGTPASRALMALALVSVMRGVEEAIQLMLPYHSANLLGWKFDMLVTLTCVGMLMLLHPVFSNWHASQRLRPARQPSRSAQMRQVHQRRGVQ